MDNIILESNLVLENVIEINKIRDSALWLINAYKDLLDNNISKVTI